MDLRPEPFVAVTQAESGRHLVFGLVHGPPRRGRDVQHVSGEVLDRDVHVHPPLPFGERHMDLARLGVHEMCLQGLPVAQQERVGEGAVAPVDAPAMQLHQQARHGVEEALAIVLG